MAERGLDFKAVEAVFAGPTYAFVDDRFAYGETRFMTVGVLDGRMVIVGRTPPGADRHVFTIKENQ